MDLGTAMAPGKWHAADTASDRFGWPGRDVHLNRSASPGATAKGPSDHTALRPNATRQRVGRNVSVVGMEDLNDISEATKE